MSDITHKVNGRPCACHCGGTTRGGKYLPGHDSKRLSILLQQVDQHGDRHAMDALVAWGRLSPAAAIDRLRQGQARVKHRAEYRKRQSDLE